MPTILLQDCGRAEIKGNTWKDLVEAYKGAKDRLDLCNQNKEALRAYYSKEGLNK